MAECTHMHLDDVKKLAEEKDYTGLIVVGFTPEGTMETFTFGRTKKQCKVLGRWLASSVDHIFTHIPFKTIFGYGNDGIPAKITKDEWASLTLREQSWVKSLSISEDDIEQ